MNGQFEVTWKTSRKIPHSLIVYAGVLEAYINFALMYTADNIFLGVPIKDLIKKMARRPRHLNLRQVQNLQY